jgi:hypothetical protein
VIIAARGAQSRTRRLLQRLSPSSGSIYFALVLYEEA